MHWKVLSSSDSQVAINLKDGIMQWKVIDWGGSHTGSYLRHWDILIMSKRATITTESQRMLLKKLGVLNVQWYNNKLSMILIYDCCVVLTLKLPRVRP